MTAAIWRASDCRAVTEAYIENILGRSAALLAPIRMACTGGRAHTLCVGKHASPLVSSLRVHGACARHSRRPSNPRSRPTTRHDAARRHDLEARHGAADAEIGRAHV